MILRTQSAFSKTAGSVLHDLRAPREHLHNVVVKIVVELPLKVPLKSRSIYFSRNQVKLVRVVVDALMLESNLDFDSSRRSSRLPLEEGMLVAREFLLNLV